MPVHNKWNMTPLKATSIALSGIFLAFIFISKLIDRFIPPFNGYSLLEIYWVAAVLVALVIPTLNYLIISLIVPSLWLAIGEIALYNPLGIILDYFLPLIMLVIMRLATNRLMALVLLLLAIISKWFFHILSGVYFWDASWLYALTFNAPLIGLTGGISLILMALLFGRLRTISPYLTSKGPRAIILDLTGKKARYLRLVRAGRINLVYKFKQGQNYFALRMPLAHEVDWTAEAAVYKHYFGPSCKIGPKGLIIKPWIHAHRVRRWTPVVKRELEVALMEFRELDLPGIKDNDWFSYDAKAYKLKSADFAYFSSLRCELAKSEFVNSHQSLDKANVLITPKSKAVLIDYEWVRRNHPLFDFAVFYVVNNTHLRADLVSQLTYQKVVFMTIIYFLLWTYTKHISLRMIYWRLLLYKRLRTYKKSVWVKALKDKNL